MKYELKCKVTPKREYVNPRKNYDTIDIHVSIFESKSFAYGNHKALKIQIHDDTPDYINIRYDIRYCNMCELEYVKTFVKDYARAYLIFNITKFLEVKIYE